MFSNITAGNIWWYTTKDREELSELEEKMEEPYQDLRDGLIFLVIPGSYMAFLFFY